jgi:cystathionine beta-lyase/cystathionine gamma-synthase
MRTLAIRMQAHTASGQAFAKAMRDFSLVHEVHYGSNDLEKSFANGFGGMVAVAFDRRVDTIAMLEACRFIKNVPSLAGTETTATLPWYSTNRMQSEDEKMRLGITLQLVRFSIGIENVQDIIADVRQAAENSLSTSPSS